MLENGSAGAGKRITLVIAVLAQFIFGSMVSSVNVALPTIGRDFAMGAVLLGWVATAYLLASAAFLVPFGRLADIYGRKKIFLGGVLLFTVASFLCAVAGSPAWLIASRALSGIGGAITAGTVVAIVTSVFSAGERGRAIGISMASVYAGLSLGPFLGGVLTQHLGWRSLFLLSAFLGLVVVVLIIWGLKGEWAEARGERFDFVGSVAFVLAVIVLMYGFTVLPAMMGIALVLLGVLGLLAFVWLEGRVPSPVLNVSLIRGNRGFVFSNLATLINYSAAFAMGFLMSLYLQYAKGLSPQTAGLILVVPPGVMTIFAPIAGWLSDRIEPRLVAAAGMAITCVALLLLIFLTEGTAEWFIIVNLAIYGVGAGLFSSPNTNAVIGSVDSRFLGVASSTVATMRSCGMMLSLGIVMIVFSVYIGHAQITPEYYPAFLTSVKVGFIIFAALCFLGIITQLAGKKAVESR